MGQFVSQDQGTSIAERQDFGTPPTLPENVRIGTSGWHYGSWRGPFYPETVRAKDQLAFYTSRFNSTEINNSFYRLPTAKAVGDWRETAPEGFCFSWKASRYITHFKRLKDCKESVDMVLTRMLDLGPSFGPCLFQLPPQMHADRERLAGFLKILPKKHRFVFEFRHQSWYEPETFELLRDHNAAFCISDHAAAPAPREVTADLVYLRGHGPTGQYHGSYPDETLEDWTEAIRTWRREKRDVFVFFDNDQKSAAPKDAERLAALLT